MPRYQSLQTLPLGPIGVVQNCYHVRSHGRGRFTFRSRKADTVLIHNLDSGDDKNWSNYFLFINKESVNDVFGFVCDTPVKTVRDLDSDPDDIESCQRLESLWALSLEERTWPNALGHEFDPPFDAAKFETPTVSLDDFNASTLQVSSRTRGKMSGVMENVRAEKRKYEPPSSNLKPIEIPASPEAKVKDSPSKTALVIPTCSFNSGSLKKKAEKTISLRLSEDEFNNISSFCSNSIVRSLANLASSSALGMDYALLMRKSVFTALETLYCSAAALRAMELANFGEEKLKENLSAQESISKEMEKALGAERVAHEETQLKLQISEQLVQELKDKIATMTNEAIAQRDNQQKKEEDIAIQYTMLARISMLLEPPEEKAIWDVQSEIGAFQGKYTDVDLVEWGLLPQNEDLVKKSK